MKINIKNQWQTGGILIVLAIIITYFLHFVGAFNSLELKSYDFRFQLRGVLPTDESDIVIVGIDDQAFMSLKRKWPFPRTYFAQAINNLSEAGAALIVIDVEFLEPSQINQSDDLALQNAIIKFPHIILAGKLVTEYGAHSTISHYPIKPLSQFISAGAQWAYINVVEDEDGFIRRYTLFQNVYGKRYLPLTVEAVRYLSKTDEASIITEDENYFILGEKIVPKFNFDSMLINYTGPAGNFPTYSLANILDDSKFMLPDTSEDTNIFDIYRESGIFRNKIVFIGASAEELQDNKFTPFFSFDGMKQKMPGVEMHANVMYSILNNSYIIEANSWLIFVCIIFLGLFNIFMSNKIKPLQSIVVIVAIGVSYFIVSYLIFKNSNIWVPVIYPLFSLIVGYFFNIINKVLVEQQEKSRFRKTFQQYVARSVVDTMLNTGELPKFGGERKNLTILFSDIRSFTTFSEKHTPEVVVQVLSEYLTEMTDIIFKYKGTLDKFVGDEIMAEFGAPYSINNHAERACLTALDMIVALRKLQKTWSKKKKEYFHIGIGINTGKVIAGNLGSNQLFDYTVIGDEVNLGARLEGANKHYSTTIIISESTYKEVKDKAIARELDYVRVKGKKRPVKIYELRGMYSIPKIEQDLIIDIYSYGLNLFKQKKWAQALKEFRRVLRYFPSDGPSRVYTMRCLEFIETPPPDNWDGIYEFAVK